MAETIMGALQAKTGGNTSVKILPVDVYGCGETTTTFDVANGIVQAVNGGAKIINLSLGSTGDSQLLHNTINQVVQQGIPVYAAAGNEPVTTPTYPAAYPGVVAVTATDASGQIAPYANRGSFVDMAISGDNIVNYNGQSWFVEGTSTSTAFASGMAAGLADHAHDCADQAQGLLQSSMKAMPKP
jgi:thermitase